MDYREVGNVDGVPICVPVDNVDRMRSNCGRDCEPDPAGRLRRARRADHVRLPEHGIQRVVDPF